MSKVIGTFASRDAAEFCIRELRNSGLTTTEYRWWLGSLEKAESSRVAGPPWLGADTALEGTATGGAIGGMAGLLAGLGALAIPGIGPIVAAGPIAATLTGGL